MEPWAQHADTLEQLLRPSTFPVGVTLTADASRIPPGARRPLRDLNHRMAVCQGFAMARRYGWTVAFTREDTGCAIASHTYGWEKGDPDAAVDFMTHMNYAADEETARRMMSALDSLETGDDRTVICASLKRASVAPDVVLIYVNPAQLMRLIHAATQGSGTPVDSRFSGRAASCTEGVVRAYRERAIQVVVPGNGDRVWAGCQDHEMIMAVPAEKLPDIVDGLKKTHQKGIRYPVPTYLRYTPEVAFSLPLSEIFTPGVAEKLP